MILNIFEEMVEKQNTTFDNNTREIIFEDEIVINNEAMPMLEDYMNSQSASQEELHNDLYHLPFLTKILVFVFMFSFIALPSMVAFVVCYTKDRKYQKNYKLKAKLENEERPDPALPYNALLYRPVPSSKKNSICRNAMHEMDVSKLQVQNKQRKVSFARNVVHTTSTSSMKSAPVANYEDLEDDVFPEEPQNPNHKNGENLSQNNKPERLKELKRRHSDYGITSEHIVLPGQVPECNKYTVINDAFNNNNNNSTASETSLDNNLSNVIPLITVSNADENVV